MLLLAFNWIYIFILAFTFGCALLDFILKKTNYEIKCMSSYVFAGLAVLTVYSEIFSLFSGVGVLANVIIIVLCGIVLVFSGGSIYRRLKGIMSRAGRGNVIATALLAVIWLYFTSRGWQHTDTALYHVQSISWIENYGVVKGLANVHMRIGYNSSIFSLYALFTMRGVFPEFPLYGINGFIAFFVSVRLLSVVDIVKRKTLRIADFTKLFTFYYLTLIVDEVFSPASDYPAILLTLYIVNAWLDLLEEKEKDITPYCLLSVLAVYTASIKVTMALTVLLVIKPAIELIKERRVKEIVLYLSLGIGILAPWLIRNVIISGYLIYPLEGLDIFNVKWKVHPEIVHFDALQIKEWARGLDGMSLDYMESFKWIPVWFSKIPTSLEKLFVLFDLAAVLVCIGYFIYLIIVKQIKEKLDYILFEAVIIIGYIYWQVSAPMPRYGYAFLLLPMATVLGIMLKRVKYIRLVKLAMALIVAYKAFAVGKYTVADSGILLDAYVVPDQYEDIDGIAYNVGGILFSENGNQYEEDKQYIIDRDDIDFLNEKISEGFYNVYK